MLKTIWKASGYYTYLYRIVAKIVTELDSLPDGHVSQSMALGFQREKVLLQTAPCRKTERCSGQSKGDLFWKQDLGPWTPHYLPNILLPWWPTHPLRQLDLELPLPLKIQRADEFGVPAGQGRPGHWAYRLTGLGSCLDSIIMFTHPATAQLLWAVSFLQSCQICQNHYRTRFATWCTYKPEERPIYSVWAWLVSTSRGRCPCHWEILFW